MVTVAVLALFRLTPPAVGRLLGRRLGRCALALRRREKARGLANLAAAYPELEPQAREKLLTESAVMLGGNFFDMIAARKLARDEGRFGYAAGEEKRYGGLAGQMGRLLDQGRGLILLTCHLGSWELLGVRVARELERLGRGPLAVVTGTVHNEPVDRLLQARRRAAGLLPVPRRDGLRPLLEHLRQGGAAAFLLDQKLADGDPVATFFGRPAPTPDGMAKLAVRMGVPVLPVAMAWDAASGRHLIHRLPVLNAGPAVADAEPAGRERELALQQECQSALEALIRRNPEQWVWFHDRWLARNQERQK